VYSFLGSGLNGAKSLSEIGPALLWLPASHEVVCDFVTLLFLSDGLGSPL
jgi:hypothetical protein